MRILHVISSGGMYGAEAVILNLSNALKRAGHHSTVGVFSPDPKADIALHTAALAQGIDSLRIPCHGQIDLSAPSAIRSIARQAQADIVHAHGYKADVYAFFALRRSPTPLVSTCHTWYDNDFFVRLYGAVDRRVLRSYAGVVAVSDDVRQRLVRAGVAPDRVPIIRNGIDLQPFARENSDPPTSPHNAGRPDISPLRVGLVGRLAPEKGVDLFIRAAAKLLRTHPSTQFVVVGDGPDRAKLAALIEELGVSANVSLLGRSEDMPALYASLDLLVSSSRHEGLPVALLEGMASGLPLVATAVGAVPSAVEDGRSGLLVPAEDITALTGAIRGLLDDPERRASLGRTARMRISTDFSADRMAGEYLAFYQAVASHSPSRT